MRVAFIGLGVMGFPMAGHLASKGHEVVVYNRTPSKRDIWIDRFGGRPAATPAEAAKGAEIIFACVGRDKDVESVAIGSNGVFETMSKGSVFVDHTTASADLARKLGQIAQERGLGFVDAPVSGGEQGAKNGQLTIMCGGDSESYDKAQPVMTAYARQISLLGPAGSGQLTKMVNQICIAGVVQGLSEAMSFARAAGLDVHAVVDVISKGAAQSWQMENRHKTMLEGHYDHGFAVEWMRKDLGICLQEARANGASLPLTALVDQFYAEVENMNGARWDTSSLFARMEMLRKVRV
jgi:3-hydroxyisobutyrate dehydrogenase